MEIEMKHMSREYAREVIDIFNYYIENSFAAYPESKVPYEFFNKFLELTKGYPAFIASNKENNRVLGFCFLRAYNPFPVFRETAEITYFVEKKAVNKGIGFAMLVKLEEEAKKIGIQTLLANISSENTPSINFHKKNGFTECGRFHKVGKKKGTYFDVVWFEKSLQ